MSPQRFSHWAGTPLELLVNSPLGFRQNGTLNVPWMAAQINSFGVQQREIMMSRKSGAFVPLKVRASTETHNSCKGAESSLLQRGSVLLSRVFDPFLSKSRATVMLPFKLSTQHCPCFPFRWPFFLLTQLLNWAGKRISRAKLDSYVIFLNQKTHYACNHSPYMDILL